MKVLKYFVFLVMMISSIQAKEYVIVVFSTKVIHTKDKNIFKKRFPTGYTQKQKNYYFFKLGHFKSYNNAKNELKNVKKYYHNAYIVEKSSLKRKNQVILVKNNSLKALSLTNMTKDSNTGKKKHLQAIYKNRKNTRKGFIQKDIAQESPTKPVHLNEPILAKKEIHIPLASSRISYINNRPTLKEPKILENWQIPEKYKTVDTNKYDILNLSRYMDALFNYNDSAKEAYYKKKISYVLSEIKKDKYGFDVYAQAYARTGRSVSLNGNNIQGNGGYTNVGVSLNANKLLFDGQYWLINHTYDILYKRLAQIQEINAQEKLSLLGTSIYTNMYAAQEEVDMYNEMIKKQAIIKKIVDEGYRKGKNSVLVYIGAENDYINLQRAVLNARYNYLYNDYILRQSIKSKSKKPFKLYPAKIELNTNSLKVLQKEAIKQSSDIAIQSNILKLKETDLKSDKNRYYPIVNFTSNIGYGLTKDNTFDLGNAGKGVFWALGLTARIPLYNRGDILLSKERDMYNILNQRRILSAKQRTILTQIEKSYNEIKRIEKQKYFLIELLKLSYKKLKILTKRYLSGISPYKDYSDALVKYLNYKNQLIKTEQNYINESSMLSVLIGKKKFYEQN